MRRRLAIGLAVAAGVSLALGVYAYGSRGPSDEPAGFDVAHSDLTFAEARGFPDFALYSVGERFEGLELTGITRRDDRPAPYEPMRADYVGFLYGDCEAVDEAGCALPLQIQVWPACVRNHASYQLTPNGGELPHIDLRVRGVPAALYEDGGRLEIYTGSETVVVFGFDEAQLLRAARAMTSVNEKSIAAGEPLPAAAAGALEGKLSC